MSWVDKLQDMDSKKSLGIELLKKGAFEQAKRVLEEAKEILDTYHRGQSEQLNNQLNEARTRIVEKNMALGDSHLAEGNLDAAKEAYRISLDLAGSREERDEILIKLGQIDQREEPSENLERLGERVGKDPDSAEAIYDFATELAMEGYFPEAIRYFERLTELTPDDADVFYRLGNTYTDIKRMEDAERAYHRSIALNFEDTAEIYFRLGLLEMEGRASHVEAKKQFKKGLEIRADHLECLKQLAHLNKLEENYEQAIEYLQSALKYDADDAGTCNELGDLYEAQGKSTEAKEFWNKAIELEPDGDDAEYAREKLSSTELKEESAHENA